jgi:nucleoside 2-deoxyribosyltransferase
MKAYLAGAILGQSDAECREWRKDAAKALAEIGVEALDPLRRDFRGVEVENMSVIIDANIADIEASDIVLVKGNIPSWGTAMEIVYAYGMDKFIVVWGVGDVISPWLKFHTDAQEKTMELALARIVEFIESTKHIGSKSK